MTRRQREAEFDFYTVRLPRWTEPTMERIDRFAVTFAIVVSLLAVPVAGAVGLAVYDSNRDLYAQQALSRQSVTATVVDGAAGTDLRRDTVRVNVEWYWAATRHTGVTRASPAVEAGDTVEIWVDEDGSMVSAPTPPTTATLDATVVAGFTWLVAAAVAVFAVVGVRILRARMRDDTWQRDLDRLLEGG
jgi:hypothetical protein